MAVIATVDDVSKRFRLYKEPPGQREGDLHQVRRARPLRRLLGAEGRVARGRTRRRSTASSATTARGKSTLLRVMAGIHKPTSGKVTTEGRISALLELGAGFHPELTGRENIYLNAAILGLQPQARPTASSTSIVEFSGLEEFIDTPGEALLERHVRAPRLLGGGARRPADPAHRRGHRRRRRGVPAPLLRPPGQPPQPGRHHRAGHPRHEHRAEHVRPRHLDGPRRGAGPGHRPRGRRRLPPRGQQRRGQPSPDRHRGRRRRDRRGHGRVRGGDDRGLRAHRRQRLDRPVRPERAVGRHPGALAGHPPGRPAAAAPHHRERGRRRPHHHRPRPVARLPALGGPVLRRLRHRPLPAGPGQLHREARGPRRRAATSSSTASPPRRCWCARAATSSTACSTCGARGAPCDRRASDERRAAGAGHGRRVGAGCPSRGRLRRGRLPGRQPRRRRRRGLRGHRQRLGALPGLRRA